MGEAQIRGAIEQTNRKVKQLKKGLYKKKAQDKRSVERVGSSLCPDQQR